MARPERWDYICRASYPERGLAEIELRVPVKTFDNAHSPYPNIFSSRDTYRDNILGEFQEVFEKTKAVKLNMPLEWDGLDILPLRRVPVNAKNRRNGQKKSAQQAVPDECFCACESCEDEIRHCRQSAAGCYHTK